MIFREISEGQHFVVLNHFRSNTRYIIFIVFYYNLFNNKFPPHCYYKNLIDSRNVSNETRRTITNLNVIIFLSPRRQACNGNNNKQSMITRRIIHYLKIKNLKIKTSGTATMVLYFFRCF